MAKKSRPRAHPAAKTVTAERAARLYRLLCLLGKDPQTRDALMERLKLDIRGFYRDLELLRGEKIAVVLEEGRYHLRDRLDHALARLPFPDPRLALGEAELLAKGRTVAHRKLKRQLAAIVDKRASKR